MQEADADFVYAGSDALRRKLDLDAERFDDIGAATLALRARCRRVRN
jgi:hypothetical protein